MIDNKRQQAINDVIGRILRGLAYDQHINGIPLTFSVGISDGADMINNVIVIHEAPGEIIRDIMFLEEHFPGVKVDQKRGGIWIDCEHVHLEKEKREVPFFRRIRELVGCPA